MTDPVLQAVERNAFVIASAMTVAALFVRPRPQLAIAVAAGALLVGVSYWTLKRGLTMLAALIASAPDAALIASESSVWERSRSISSVPGRMR